ncbi:cytotoxic necrotizing factor Rho-activating domain-containing protein [Burkholderia ubonensis]|uniref:cytotoxic necrotizing factor Rho-activating domain-containing protein n=1 Tax=Burkholderia ubonensis TaxID=101571 RepID=UPI000AF9FD5C|nr:cytotoxic necrotizing factor Rho-activating domain-containing protein [Burkholderia ubonensis]
MISNSPALSVIRDQLRQQVKQGQANPRFGLVKNGEVAIYKSKLDGLLHPNQTRRARDFVRELTRVSTAHPDLHHVQKALIRQGGVVRSAGNFDATQNFRLDVRHNKIVTTSFRQEQLLFERDKMRLLSGSLAPLIGKGIVACAGRANVDIPSAVEQCIRNDNEGVKTGGDARAEGFIEFFHGGQAKATELIPGTPIGNFYNKFKFGDRLQVFKIKNGLQGTVGMQFDTTRMEDGDCCLFSAGALSGCTVIYALKGDMLYAYHAGTKKNCDSDWETATDGASSIYNTHRMMTSDVGPDNSAPRNNSELAAFLDQHFDFSMMVYNGKGTPLPMGDSGRVFRFDYSKTSLEQGLAHAGNALALVKKEGDVIKIAMLGENMAIDDACRVQSLDARLYECEHTHF